MTGSTVAAGTYWATDGSTCWRRTTTIARDRLAGHPRHAALAGLFAGLHAENLKVQVFQAGERFISRFAARVVAVSAAQKRRLVGSGVRADRVDVVHNAIDLAAMEGTVPVDLRRRFGLPSGGPLIISIGRFSPEKGQVDLVRAAERVLEREPAARFNLFGDGPDLAGVRAEVAHRRLADRVFCPG